MIFGLFQESKKQSSKEFCSRTKLTYDLHSHLLPGVDDGVETIDESLECINELTKLGYKGALITPHIFPEVFDNNEQDLYKRFTDFKNYVTKYFPNFSLGLGAEYFYCEQLIQKIKDKQPLLTFGKASRPLILIEFPVMSEPFGIKELIYLCISQGIQPIFAHIERYKYLQKETDLQQVLQWKKYGALMQMDLGSAIGQYGLDAQNTARNLIETKMYDFLGSDIHRPHQIQKYLKPSLIKINQKYEYIWNLENNHKILI